MIYMVKVEFLNSDGAAARAPVCAMSEVLADAMEDLADLVAEIEQPGLAERLAALHAKLLESEDDPKVRALAIKVLTALSNHS